LWTLLLAASFAGVVACVVGWFILLSTICSNPRTPVPQTQHVIPYSCHGMQFFLSPLGDAMLHWLIPVGLLCMVLSLVAAAMVARPIANAWLSAVNNVKPYRVRIIGVPPGEAPDWVREQWVGLELPLAQASPTASSVLSSGVLSGPRSFFAANKALILGQYQRRQGFKVNVIEALTVLESASPEAANWWRANAPHLMKPSRFFVFSEEVCAVVQ